MKLKFKNQEFQTNAVNAVVDLFRGQEEQNGAFSVIKDSVGNQMQFLEQQFGNDILIDNKKILENMHEIQKRNLLPITDSIDEKKFCIEMETGTGKTYVYTKTIFELNKKYGFTKFIIVVPSVAIREGVYKSFQTTEEHFKLQYDNVPYRYFIYDSKKIHEVRRFATSSTIEIMIINIDAFKKSENIINQERDSLNGEVAIDYIRNVKPIVIIDEPQSVDNTPKAKEAIVSLNPLCTLRYSATHREKVNLLYRLTPVDAYQLGLVKQICVTSSQVGFNFNQPYIRLVSVSHDNGFKAKIELDVKDKKGKVARKTVTVKSGADLFVVSGERKLYSGYTIAGIDCTKGSESIEFTNAEVLYLGKSMGDIDENIIKRNQIKKTIETHLTKELLYLEKGIKVLSLFFIDEVKKYRTPEGDKGIYAKMFEEEYIKLINLPKFEKVRKFYHKSNDVQAESPTIFPIHDGYFSQDKKGNYKNTKGDSAVDYSTYNTIMKDKERLLSFDCPLRFIFSHSALKEGWDNPNVFQVCTLIEQKSTFTCRQKIGRGLRLCVNQDGDRIEDKNINILHVIANESFSEFADKLQKEIEDETGLKFGTLEISNFTGMVYPIEKEVKESITKPEAEIIVESMKENGYITEDGTPTNNLKTAIETKEIELPKEIEIPKETIIETVRNEDKIEEKKLQNVVYLKTVKEEKTITYDDAKEIIEHFMAKNLITKTGKIKDTMKNELLHGNLDLPERFKGAKERCMNIIKKADNKTPIRDGSKDVIVRINKQKMLSPEFMAIWDKIKQKTTYRVKVNTSELISDCIKEIKNMVRIPTPRIISTTGTIDVQKPGVKGTLKKESIDEIDNSKLNLPDVLLTLEEECGIPVHLCHDILAKSGRLKDFINNPQEFTENCIQAIKDSVYNLEIDGIRYVKLAGEDYYVQEIFEDEELIANLDKNAVPVKNSVYDHVIYDSSTVEKPFAAALDNDPDVKMFFKIPDNFKIETPIGTYNPDWAVYLERNGTKKIYFVIETKGSTDKKELRDREDSKITCAKQHFKALNNGTDFGIATNWRDFKIRNIDF